MIRCCLCLALLPAMMVGGATSAPALAVRWNDISRQPAAWYAGAEARAIAASILLYQTKEGGWPKNTDMTAPPSAAFLANLKFDHRAPTIDNDATFAQLRYVAQVITAHDDPELRAAFLRGFDYLLADPSDTFFKELVRYHISGQLKVAPEHVSDQVLRVMGKPPHAVYQQFVEK